MKLKLERVFSKVALWGLALMFIFTSCNKDDEATQVRSSEEVSVLFESVYLKKGDLPQLPNAKEGQYFGVVDDGDVPCQLFNQVTGISAIATEKYEYVYKSEDGKCSIRIVGKKQLTGNDICYATMYVEIPGRPEISVIEIYSEAIVDSVNGILLGGGRF